MFAEKICVANGQPVDDLLGTNMHEDAKAAEPPALDSMKEALAYIDPDLAYDEWWKVIAALADAYGETGRDLARNWSSGDLRGVSASKFCPEKFDRQFDDIFDLQDELTQKIASIVAPELERVEDNRAKVNQPQNLRINSSDIKSIVLPQKFAKKLFFFSLFSVFFSF